MNVPFINFINNQINPQLICPVPNNNNLISQPVAPIPPGLEALYLHCHQIYPEQPNPLQLTSVKKYWLGGNNFLDYITLYNNPGDPKKNVPPHWHYISFGLSDLYGDGRVHPLPLNPEVSGFGFELTFRLKRDPNDYVAPIWPANIMQSLARYVFNTRNILCSGDHVSENRPLDNSDSKIQHMLMTDDPQLGTILGPLGKVSFIQIVGVTNEELKASQQWNVNGIIDLMKKIHDVGGDYLVTDMQRTKTIFEINKDVKLAVERGINNEGSNLSGVSAKCSFKTKISLEFVKNFTETDEENTSSVNEDESSDINSEEYETDSFSENSEKNSLSDKEIENKNKSETETESQSIENHLDKIKEGISNINISTKNEKIVDTTEDSKVESEKKEVIDKKKEIAVASQSITSPIKSECSSSMSVSHENQNNNCTSSMSYSSETGAIEPFNCLELKYLKEVHITLNLEAGLLLPLVLKGRLKHNHHFTYKSIDLAITFLTPSVTGSYVTPEKPFAYYGSWLQILLQNNLIEEMLADLEDLEDILLPEFLPRTFCWRNLAITFEPDER